MLVKHGKYNFVLGVSWHLPQDKKDMKDLMSQRPGQSRVIVKAGESTWVGFDEHRGVGVSAALVIASLYPDLLVAERLSDDQYWLCAIHQGMPSPGRDILVGVEEARNALQEWISFFPNMRVYGDIQGAQGPVAEVWEHVLETIAAKEISPRKLRDYTLKTILTQRELALIVTGVFALVTVAGIAWMVFRPKPLTPQELEAQERSALESQALIKAEQDRKAAIAVRIKTHKDQVAALNTRIDQARTHTFLPAWLKLFRGLPPSINGYRPTNMLCIQQACQIEWRGVLGAQAQDKFALESRTGAAPRSAASAAVPAQAPGGPGPAIQLSNSLGDYGALLDYAVQTVPRRHVPRQVDLPDLSERGFERLRARLLDLNTALTRGKSQIQINPPRPMLIPGVPDGQVADALVAYTADLHVSANGPAAGHDLLQIDAEIARQLAGRGVVLQWNRLVLMGSSGTDSIVADGALYLTSQPPQ